MKFVIAQTMNINEVNGLDPDTILKYMLVNNIGIIKELVSVLLHDTGYDEELPPLNEWWGYGT